MLEYEITARRTDAHGSVARCKATELILDTDVKGRTDAFNPAELMLAAVAACILKNLERIAPMIHLEFRGASVKVNGVRQDRPPKMIRIAYTVEVDTDAEERKLNLLHDNIRKYGTIYNTIAAGTELAGTVRRAASLQAGP